MNRTQQAQMSTARKAAVAGLAAAAAGIIVQMLGGADYPAVPPGAVLLVAGAVLFAIRTRWTPVAGLLVPVFLCIGAVATPNMRDALGDPSRAVVFAGMLVQLLGMVAGLVSGAAVVVQVVRKGRRG
jgi:glucose dehydrogenase